MILRPYARVGLSKEAMKSMPSERGGVLVVVDRIDGCPDLDFASVSFVTIIWPSGAYERVLISK
jgi:hypothetical protein